MKKVQRGEIYYANLSPTVGSEQSGYRPVLIVQNDTGNQYSPTTIVAALTSQIGKAKMPTHIVVDVKGLAYRSVVLTEQIRTLDKRRLEQYLDRLSEKQMESVDQALKISLDLENDNR